MLFDAISQLNQQYAKQKATKPRSKRRTHEKHKIKPAKTKKARQLQLQYNNKTTIDRRIQLQKMVAKPAK